MAETRRVQCCIAGGGPAGMMLGLLLARGGVSVLVLEKHADFLRDFRGDTIHPSTLEIMSELGLLDAFLEIPHQELQQLTAQIGDTTIRVADFSRLRARCKFIALLPQWEFLTFLATQAGQSLSFALRMEAEATDLLREGDRICGLRAKTPTGLLEVHADLTVGADGRHSTIRDRGRLAVRELGAPMDVLWLRLPRTPGDPPQTLGRADRGRVMVMIDRRDYWQCAYLIKKGSFHEIRKRGLEAFRKEIAAIAPVLANRVAEIQQWDDVKLLTVLVDRLDRWYRPGLLCIGDAAHAMSPIGGVGINLAIQDAVAAANLLAQPLLTGTLSTDALAAVQRRRGWPTRVTQRAQVTIQNHLIEPFLGRPKETRVPRLLRLLARFRWFRRLPARAIGLGIRPEHVVTGRASRQTR
jgi:2-polyprenyl-6-methoxyphenol hydroxylase-like FAD-dependent oxidoreductase